MDMKLREICDAFGVSRRAVQGYEKAGLVSASDKNKWGHLLYNADSQERIKQIKLFQQMGFSIQEIKGIIDAPNDILKPVLENQVEKLKEEQEDIENLIDKVRELIENLS